MTPTRRRSSVLFVTLVLGVAAACGDIKEFADAASVDGTELDAGDLDAPATDAGDVDAPDVPVDAAIDAALPIDGPGTARLTVVRSGAGPGTITSAPAGISCGATCTFDFPTGTLVTLTAAPGVGGNFSGWGGACSGSITTCSITVNANTVVNADFAVATHTVTVVTGGNGTGTVTSSAGGITCPGTCTATVPYGTSITLSASTTAPSMFVGWSGGTCAGTAACTFNVTSNVTINASFALNFTLVVSRAGNGSGTVTSSPAGIACGTDCDQTYAAGTMVTLTAAAAADSTFTGWTGSGCSGTGTCTVTVNGATAVAAGFTLRQYTLTAAKTGLGAGTVTSSPAGINCGTDCNELYNHGQMVTLTATPTGAGNVFGGWSGGGCSGTATTCTTTVTAATTVTADFDIAQVTLTVARGGGGAGTITSTPAGISCGATCATAFNYNTSVTLSAVAATSPLASVSTFTGWSGAGCSGTSTCTVTLTAATTVTANFALQPNLAFVTSTSHTGNLGGLAGADAICQARAQGAGLPGTYRAWLSTTTINAITRLGTASGWTRVDGRPFANSRTDLTGGKILYTLTLDERGGDANLKTVRTATRGEGTFGSGDCAVWTDGTSTNLSSSAGTSSYGTFSWSSNTSASCTTALPLYCFGVDRSAAVSVPVQTVATVRRVFLSAPWNPSGGLAGADAVCQAEAGDHGLAGTYRALLASYTAAAGISAASRFNTSGLPWARVDHVIVDSTAAAFLNPATPAWDAAINVTGAGNYDTYNTWAGASTLTTGGTAATTCANWTTSVATSFGWVGNAWSTQPSVAFANYDTQGSRTECDAMQRLICMQQ